MVQISDTNSKLEAVHIFKYNMHVKEEREGGGDPLAMSTGVRRSKGGGGVRFVQLVALRSIVRIADGRPPMIRHPHFIITGIDYLVQDCTAISFSIAVLYSSINMETKLKNISISVRTQGVFIMYIRVDTHTFIYILITLANIVVTD